MPNALIIEDGIVQLRAYGALLQKTGFKAFFATDVKTALEVLQNENINFIICDLHLEDGKGRTESGIELIQTIRKFPGYENVEILAYTADSSSQILMDALEAGADDAYSKYIGPKVLQKKFEKVKQRFEANRIPQDREAHELTAAAPTVDVPDPLAEKFEEYHWWINKAVSIADFIRSKKVRRNSIVLGVLVLIGLLALSAVNDSAITFLWNSLF